MKEINFKTNQTCAKEINFKINNNTIKDLEFIGGCSGNLKAISTLLEGEDIDQIIKKLKGITCGARKTSCSDQLTKALEENK